MSKQKLRPLDADKEQPDDDLVVKREKDKQYQATEPDLPNPAEKRHYSEQPPIRRNSKT